jgi:hypothetical protein
LEGEGVLLRAQEAILTGHLLGEGRNQAFPIDGDAEMGLDALEDVGDGRRRAVVPLKRLQKR